MLLPIPSPQAAAQCTTTVTGKVYSPLGPATGDPIPNILVYIPQTAVLPFSTTVGAGVTGGCSAQANLVSGNPLVNATTDAGGNFSLTTTGLTTGTYNVVIQAGKWRRQYPNTAITACQANAIGNLTMPSTTNTTDGTIADLPHIAVVTGSADAIECIFQQIGIAGSEITNPGQGGSINFYQGITGPGQYLSNSSANVNNTPPEADLVGVPATLDNYDVVIFGCQGSKTEADATPTNQQNMVDYANAGGRIFATHYGYNWLDNISPFDSSADWTDGVEALSSATGVVYPATIDQSYAEGVVLAQWLQNIHASYNNVQGQIGLEEVRTDTTAVHNPPAQSWVSLNSSTKYTGNPSMQFTFDTPIGATGVPTVAATYTNTTTRFQPGDEADSIVVNVTNNSGAAATSTLILTISMPGGVTATSAADTVAAIAGWTCAISGGGATVTCTRTTALAASMSDNVALTFSIASTANVGQSTITASLSGGNISSTDQCGRVLFNDYHVEQTSGNRLYPAECSTGLTAQERFLEFSLYNLSNFVAPTASDVIDVQEAPTITWATPAPITYGTPLSGTQLDATANVPGTFVYTPAAGTVPGLGSDTLSVVFTPTDTTDYLSATASVVLSVLPAATTTTITGLLSPIYYGQIIGDVAEVVVNTPNTGGYIDVYIDGQNVCMLPVITGVTETCPATTGVGYSAGTHTIYAAFTGNPEYAPSTSPTYTVVVLPDPTTAGVASSANPAIVGQAVQLTATIGDPYATAAGMVNFFDGTTQIGSGTLNAQGVAVLTTSALIVGTHNITACLVASENFNASCSTVLQQQVMLLPSGPLATVTLLGSSVNPSVVGQSVTFSATVGTTGAFVAIPAGTVTFLDGTATIGTATLDSNGDASFSTSSLTAGLHTITAAYAGNSATAASVSAPVMQQVNTSAISAGAGFVMTVTPTAFSTGIGVSTAVSVTITDLNGFDQAVQLACAGLPNETTCAFAQSTIGAGGGTTALIVSPTPPRPCSAVTTNASGPRSGLPWMMAFAAGAFFVRRRRRLLQGLVLMAALCALPLLSGCGDCADLGTKPGTYSFTITGTAMGGSTPISHTQTMQMIIHP